MIRTLEEKMKLVEEGKLVPADTAQCAVCLRMVRLRNDGTIGQHQNTFLRPTCGGVGHLPSASGL